MPPPRYTPGGRVVAAALVTVALAASIAVAAAETAETADPAYRGIGGWSSRIVIWVVAELHLMFGAFVLGVPIVASIVEVVGWRTGEPRWDRLAHELTALLAAAFSTTAAFGGLLTFALIGLYPRFVTFLSNVFHPTYYVYAGLFFAEGFTLYLYYYGWARMQGRGKALHVVLGVLLNVWGTALMLIANAWAAWMMAPSGIDRESLAFVGTTWQAVTSPLWLPLAIHRAIGNVAFGGFVVAAYAAVKFLAATRDDVRAHYDWMGYVGNFVGLAALIPLPFAGYYLGREVYSASPVMGNTMMGGAFSWTFILQAVLVGVLFVGGNYYLWIGMARIDGAERYRPWIKYLNVALLVAFAVWLTPRNLPLSAEEQAALGGQFHPLLRYLGLMAAKNAAVSFIILSTFVSFLLYRRANFGPPRPFSAHGVGPRVVLGVAALGAVALLLSYARHLGALDPATVNLTAAHGRYLVVPIVLLGVAAVTVAVSAVLALRDRGLAGQALVLGWTVLAAVGVLGVYGFVVMERANPFLRQVAVAQWLMVVVCLGWNTVLDVIVFRGAGRIGEIRWGRMPARSQYALVLLCVTIVLLMGLMGYVRSGLREDWHVYGVLRDTSAWAWTPTNAYMTRVVGAVTLVFLAMVSFVFWLAGLTSWGASTGPPIPPTLGDAPGNPARPSGPPRLGAAPGDGRL